tara:strand:+ start:705 stop:1910 length:1206 start_codon:yes stop_codon:yes gene_type:complete
VEKNTEKIEIDRLSNYQSWPWWPLLPLYPYGKKRTIFKEIIPNQIWSFEQLQGIYYVAVPVRLSVIKVPGGLMLFNSLPPTPELLKDLKMLVTKHGPVKEIILPTASGLEHKISLPSLSRLFPDSNLWICPGQWSFPFDLPLDWIGIPSKRTKVLFDDGLPYPDLFEWFSLGPLDIGLGRFQEVSCFHKKSKSLLVTDALIGIESAPPELFDLDPTPLLFHARERGDELLVDNFDSRAKGWRRIVLFASFLRPAKLSIPSVVEVLKNSFRAGLRNPRAHFGIYPFSWEKDWQSSAKNLLSPKGAVVQIAPVLERLVFPRSKETYLAWLDKVASINGLRWLISSHYTAPLRFSRNDAIDLRRKISKKDWAPSKDNWSFLNWLDNKLVDLGVVPADPLKVFKD